jgi:hypothetical protein
VPATDSMSSNRLLQDKFDPLAARRQYGRSLIIQGGIVMRALVKGKPGVRLELAVESHAGRRHLPIVRVQRAAYRSNVALPHALAMVVCARNAH